MKKENRVKKTDEIELIIKEKKYAFNLYFTVYKKKNIETGKFRYAMSVGKKIGNAVLRNHYKRWVRAVVDSLPLVKNLSYDVFIIVKPKALELSYQEFYKQLEYLFKKQKLIQGEKND